MIKKRALKFGAAFAAFSLLYGATGTVMNANEHDQLTPYLGETAGTWYETAWATWQGQYAGDYRVFVRLSPEKNAYYWRTGEAISPQGWDIAEGWTEIDSELIRKDDAIRNVLRVDIPGLPQGTYDLKITALDGTTVLDTFGQLQTESFPRMGAAFVPSHELISNQAVNNWAPYGATGGYLSDGRIDPEAEILYVSHEDWENFTVADLQRGSSFRGNRPVIVRFLGTVGAFERVANTPAAAGAVLPSGAMTNNRMMTLNGNSHGITFEGIGHDATLYGWGLFTGGASNIVFRNLSVDQYFQQGFRASGASSNVWVHHNDFKFGQNRMMFNDEPTDRSMGQGAVDIEQNVRGYTIGYNHFSGGRGTHLIVGGVQNVNLDNNVHRHYGTLHHNLYQSAQERNPRTRHHNLHMFNNLFVDVLGHPMHYRLMDRYTGYGIGAAHNATIWAEGNLFDDVGFPFLRSRHGHARGVYPHTGHNHFFGDGPGFLVTGDNVSWETGQSLGAMAIPAHGAGLGYRNSVRGMATAAQHADFKAAVGRLQPNVIDSSTATTFDPALDIGITVDQAATMMMPPAEDQETAAGFPALNGNANTHGWGFDGEFRPSTTEGIWPTTSPEAVEALRHEILHNAGPLSAPAPTEAPAAPLSVEVSLNNFEYIMHRQASPTPSLRTISHPNTFTINWSDASDVMTEAYEIGLFVDGAWQVLSTMEATARPNRFTTQHVTDFGFHILYNAAGERVIVHFGGDGFEIMYPRAGFPGVDESALPTPEELIFGSEWVIADLANGGNYQFGVRAVNEIGKSAWTTQTFAVSPDSARMAGAMQLTEALPGLDSTVTFEIQLPGLADGSYDMTLSVPRSRARNVMPWPAAQNFTGSIFLDGSIPMSGDGPVTGNGGSGQLQVENGVAVLSVQVRGNVPQDIYDMVLTVQTDERDFSTPFSLIVGERELVGMDYSASVTQLNGNTNDLHITLTRNFSFGPAETTTKTFNIRNNASGTYLVDGVNIFVNTQGNTQIREIRIVD